ncbi:MAG: carbonic anhydrase [Pirellulales bacterium]|nr:carbonic anhydrase [Pirellulales bacterium]
MKKLIAGVQHFQKDSFRAKQPLFEELAKGQQPLALFITCSDSRIDPNLLTHTEPGELFVVRNAGNIVPPYESGNGGEAATIEYAVNVLKVDDIIVCGHSHCGAMAGTLAPDSLTDLPAVRDWISHAVDSGNSVPDDYGPISESPDPLMNAVEQNIFVQLEHLRSHPSVADALSRNEVTLHGWVYKFETGEVFAYDSTEKRFLPVDATIN